MNKISKILGHFYPIFDFSPNKWKRKNEPEKYHLSIFRKKHLKAKIINARNLL